MGLLILESDRLQAELSPPGELYTAARFDWTTQLRQLSLKGRPLLTREKQGDLSPASQGWGLAGEFGIETPVGFADCPVGGWFIKMGVGLLKRPDERPYHFGRFYEIVPARFTVAADERSVVLIAEQEAERGYGYRLERRWSVGTELTLTTLLTNTGTKTLRTEEYNHNFFALDASAKLTLPRSWDTSAFGEFVDKESILSLNDRSLTWKKTPTRDFFLSDPRPGCTGWALSQPWGRVEESVDFEAVRFNLWGHSHVVSPELYYRFELDPGASLRWTRRWSF